jgi:hypothetical protein
MVQNFGMIANYGELKGKATSTTAGVTKQLHETTRRTSSGARSKETVGTAIRPRGSYRRRGKGLGNIDSKCTRVE